MTFFAVTGWLLAMAAGVAAWRLNGALLRAEAERSALRERTHAALVDAEASVRRIRDESERARPFAAEPVLRDLLEIVDNLDRALAAGEGGAGMAMIQRQSVDLLRRHGAVRFTCLEEPFDPNAHEAVATSPATGAPHRVLQEVAAGYHFHTRLLRPARVVVAVPLEEAAPEEAAAAAEDVASEAAVNDGVPVDASAASDDAPTAAPAPPADP